MTSWHNVYGRKMHRFSNGRQCPPCPPRTSARGKPEGDLVLTKEPLGGVDGVLGSIARGLVNQCLLIHHLRVSITPSPGWRLVISPEELSPSLIRNANIKPATFHSSCDSIVVSSQPTALNQSLNTLERVCVFVLTLPLLITLLFTCTDLARLDRRKF